MTDKIIHITHKLNADELLRRWKGELENDYTDEYLELIEDSIDFFEYIDSFRFWGWWSRRARN